ncbi:MAG TPA: TetR/AcrR family transcriptional regulator [Phenylobacterium sp.]
MKHVVTPVASVTDTKVKGLTRRALAKQQTRAKVLAAARKLFSEQGYEGATIRDIAAAAGMSTGAVFANFADKSDLFREIMVADLKTLVEEMREAARRGRGVEDTLLRVFSSGYAFYKGQLQLARAMFSVSWSPGEGKAVREFESVRDILDLLAEQLTLGVERGELVQESDVRLRSQMLFDAYLSNYPQAIFGGWSLDALQARAKDQIRILLAGAKRG